MVSASLTDAHSGTQIVQTFPFDVLIKKQIKKAPIFGALIIINNYYL